MDKSKHQQVSITVEIPGAMKELLERLAAVNHQTVEEYVAELLQWHVEKEVQEAEAILSKTRREGFWGE